MSEGFALLCSRNLFITENTEWVSFIIIAQSFQELISKVHIEEACTSVGNTYVHGCPMKKNGVDPYEV